MAHATDPAAEWTDVDPGDFSTTEIIYVDPETRARRWKTYLAAAPARNDERPAEDRGAFGVCGS